MSRLVHVQGFWVIVVHPAWSISHFVFVESLFCCFNVRLLRNAHAFFIELFFYISFNFWGVTFCFWLLILFLLTLILLFAYILLFIRIRVFFATGILLFRLIIILLTTFVGKFLFFCGQFTLNLCLNFFLNIMNIRLSLVLLKNSSANLFAPQHLVLWKNLLLLLFFKVIRFLLLCSLCISNFITWRRLIIRILGTWILAWWALLSDLTLWNNWVFMSICVFFQSWNAHFYFFWKWRPNFIKDIGWGTLWRYWSIRCELLRRDRPIRLRLFLFFLNHKLCFRY